MLKRIWFWALAGVLLAGPAAAGEFLADYDAWRSLPYDARAGYVIGIADDLQNPAHGDSPARISLAVALDDCFTRLKIKSGSLVNAVDAWYQADPERLAVPAHVAFFGAIAGGLCQDFVNAGQRRQDGSGS